MAYTPPSYNAVNFNLGSGYTQPAYNDVDFDLGDGSTQSASHTASGGAVAAGLATIVLGVTLLASGGAIAGGSAEVTSQQGNSQTFNASGGSVAGGSAVVQAVNVQASSFASSGGAIAGGVAPVARGIAHPGTGGAVAGGDALYSAVSLQIAEYFATGGAVAGGVSGVSQGISHTGIGGAVAGGEAPTSRYPLIQDVSILGYGGAVVGGTAGQVFGPSEIASGGAVAGGTADINFVNISTGAPIVLVPTISATYVKSTPSSSTTGFTSPLPAVDWLNTAVAYYDQAAYNAWRTATSNFNGAKINIDYQTAFAANKIEVFNYFDYDSGNDQTKDTAYGFSSIRVYGSNTQADFDNVTLNSVPANGTLLLSATTLPEHPGGAQYSESTLFSFSNSTNYRYYIVMFSGTYGNTQGGVRVLALRSSYLNNECDISATMPAMSATLCTRTSLVNPPAFSTTYVKSSPSYGGAYGDAFRAVNPDTLVSGAASYASWLSGSGQQVGAKINIDYGALGAFKANLLRLWNFHENGSETDKGVGSVRVYGSNTQADFDNITRNSVPASGTLLLDTTTVARETSSNGTEQWFWFGNSTQYRYYILFFPTGQGHLYYSGIRRALLQGTAQPRTGDITATLPPMRMTADAQNDGYTRILPVAQSAQYVLSASDDVTYAPHLATSQDFDTSLIGSAVNNAWRKNTTSNHQFLVHALGRRIPKALDVENFHTSGSETNRGVNAFTLYGGNDAGAFNNFDWGSTSGPAGSTLLYSGNMAQHPATDTASRERFALSNSSSYRYYYFFFLSNHGSTTHMGLRRITLWGEDDPIQWADIDAVMPALTAEFRAPVPPGIVGHIVAFIKRMVVGLSDGPPPALVTAFKAMTAFMVVNNEEGPPVGNLDITLPSLIAENPEPAWGHLAATMPKMTGALVTGGVARCTLPAITASMSARPPSISSRLECTLAPLDASLSPGHSVSAVVPALSATMVAIVQFRVVITASMRAPTCAMTGSSSADPEEIDVVMAATLPRMRMSSVAMVGRSADITATMRALSLSMHGIPGVVSRLSANIPRLSVGMSGRPSSCMLAATFPALDAEMDTSHICAPTTIKYEKGAIQ